MMTRKHIAGWVLGLGLILGNVAGASPYDEVEFDVRPSPPAGQALAFTGAETVVDFAVSPFGPDVFVLWHDAAAGYRMRVWSVDAGDVTAEWEVPPDVTPQWLVSHPAKHQLFVAGQQNQDSVLWRVEAYQGHWQATPIFRTSAQILNLVAAPRPFQTHWIPDLGFEQEYRLFFGVRHADGAVAINSVTENGLREYQVLGPEDHYITFPAAMTEEQPTPMSAPAALPQAVHPAGDLLLWQDADGCFQVARYADFNWTGTAPLWEAARCGGSVTVTPNGLGVMHWQPEQPGVTVYVNRGQTAIAQAQTMQFVSTPRLMPDGKGLVGLTQTDDGFALEYVPVSLPLSDVVNAWMFVESERDAALFDENSGLFRDLESDQLYQLYEAENYYPQFPRYATRPYFVTTDIFWELFASAYQGLFLLYEEYQAMPAFQTCIETLRAYYQTERPDSPWNNVFLTIEGLWDPAGLSPELAGELALIEQADRAAESVVLQRTVNFSELKPRGHYTQSPEWETYFKAVMYLTRLVVKNESWLPELTKLPPNVRTAALDWIRSYEPFIAPARVPMVWQDAPFTPPAYHAHPRQALSLFPLSWGFDNEALYSTVLHKDWPFEEQITGSNGPRLLPSTLDLAAALGNPFAMTLLADEFAEYPQLQAAIERLQARFQQHATSAPSAANVYDRWLQALAVQWAADITSPDGVIGQPLWSVKRLQTGLASWTTLRHATVLVNERGVAEAGEGGFEAIIMQPPRGYVEPDPQTFEAIAALFDLTIRMVSTTVLPVDEFGEGFQEPLRQGILRRLSDSAEKARFFRDIADKELRNEALTAAEYDAILHVGRVAEHHFLVYNSLANSRSQFALSTPDPMPKVADVFGGQPEGTPFLLSAVGRPLEWDQIVPYYGRRAIVRGAVYSYYEMASPALMNDAEWLEALPEQPHPAWVAPYISSETLPWSADSAAQILQSVE